VPLFADLTAALAAGVLTYLVARWYVHSSATPAEPAVEVARAAGEAVRPHVRLRRLFVGRLEPKASQLSFPWQVARHRIITDAVHAEGGRIAMQILHAGRYAYHPLAVAPSSSKSPISPFRARGMTGWNWDCSEECYRHAPELYGAIHFHDDDLDDAGWDESFTWTVPEDMPSGVYAASMS